jgi:predicted metal-dependent phosphotriesterase family hydrolase
MPHVQTVLGAVAPSDITRVMHHEHLLSLTPGPWLSGGRASRERPADPSQLDPADTTYAADQVSCAVGALSRLADYGVNTVVDLSPYGAVGRDAHGANVVLLQDIARRSNLHLVTGTAVYLQDFSPQWTVRATLDELTDRFVTDASTGIAATGVRAGILGEQATGLGRITPHEEKCLRAAARAHHATGLALNTHTTHGTMALEQISILIQEQADLRRVVIGHMDTHPDTDYVRKVLDQGVNVAFDTIGKQYWDFRVAPLPADQPEGEFTKQAYLRSDITRADRIAQLVAEGYAEQILLAHDLTGFEAHLNPTTHGQWGYTYLPGPFTDLLLERGVSCAHIDTMMQHNPVRILSLD